MYVVSTVLVGSVLLQDEAKGDSQMPVVINMDGADQRLAEQQQQQRQLIDEQVYKFSLLIYIIAINYCFDALTLWVTESISSCNSLHNFE